MTDTSTESSGLDLQWVDPQVRPQDDLFAHVNGKWLGTHKIPDDRAQDGAFRALYDRAEEDVRAIIEKGDTASDPDAQRIGALYASFMDEGRVESLGTQPLKPLLDEIANAEDKSSLAEVLGRRQREGLVALVAAYVDTDAKNSSRYLAHFNQSGLGLPDESFYRDDAYAEIRKAYVAHLGHIAALAGLESPDDIAATVMDLETALAAASWDRVTNRDAEKTYTLMTFESLSANAKGFDWSRWASAIGAKQSTLDEVIVRQPSFVIAATKLWDERPIEQLKAWMSIRTTSACAPYLSSALVDENFDFYGRTLSGTEKLRERWKRGVSIVEGALGEAVGRIYVDRHFPPSSKERMVTLVANLVEAYRQSISRLDWMSPATRERALAKLEQFTPKIGYPEKWKDYSSLETRADDLLGNVRRAGEWSTDYEIAKIGKPVDKGEWFMTPQTVNAYYNPDMNEIVFPAAILQPPFFDPNADDAANYGGIGAVIGHEIGHGFDDQGSRYDGEGNLTDWWEAADRTEFERRANALIEQYNALSPAGLPDHKVNGALTVGENIGDLGGLTIAIKAYHIALGDNLAPVIDGLTGLQRLLFGWAQVWRALTARSRGRSAARNRSALTAGSEMQRRGHQPRCVPRGLRSRRIRCPLYATRAAGPHLVANEPNRLSRGQVRAPICL